MQAKQKKTNKKTGTSTLAGQAAPADGEILDQAIVPLPSEQAVTFGSEDVAPGTKKYNNNNNININNKAAPGTPIATASADGPEPEASPSTKEIIATMTEGAKDACVSRRLRQQHPGLYNKLLVEEVFMKTLEVFIHNKKMRSPT